MQIINLYPKNRRASRACSEASILLLMLVDDILIISKKMEKIDKARNFFLKKNLNLPFQKLKRRKCSF